jgi:hypothetical protein
MVALAAACTAGDAVGQPSTTVATPTSAPVATPTSAPASAPPTTGDTSAGGAAPSTADRLCAATTVESTGRVANPDLAEASGLVASRTHPGVLWTHDDGGERPGVFAVGIDGSDLGFFELPEEVAGNVVDAEDLAIADGPAGGVLYLADIGDNRAERSTVTLYRFPEPDPGAPGPIAGVERLVFTYPDRPHNAETLLLDEANGRAVIVTKQQAAAADGRPDPLGATGVSAVFEGPLDRPGDVPVELTASGVVDAPRLERRTVNVPPHPASLLGVGGVVTGGDVSSDGALVALRTYETVWLWAREPGRSVAETLAELTADRPCQVATAIERQGEGVAFVDGGLMTLGEGRGSPLHRVRP